MVYELNKFLDKVQEIANEKPQYSNGGTGKNGVCDCIGLVMGAMYRLGHKQYALHSSNYFARLEQVTLNTIGGAPELFDGEILYAAKNPNEAGYDLNDRYINNPNFSTGDLTDYYHAGVVLTANPLVIIECTGSSNTPDTGIVITNKLNKKWDKGGMLKDLDYDTYTGRTDGSEDNVATIGELQDKTCKVVVPEGTSTSNMRAKPTKDSGLIARVPAGDSVLVTKDTGEEYVLVKWDDVAKNKSYTGYMLRSTLEVYSGEAENTETPDNDGTETLSQVDIDLNAQLETMQVNSNADLETLIYKTTVATNASVAYAQEIRTRAYERFPEYAYGDGITHARSLEDAWVEIDALKERLAKAGL